MTWIDVVTRIKFWRAMVLIVAILLVPGNASACIAWDLQRIPFFEKEDVAPIIADVTIVSKSILPDSRIVLIAGINQTLRGEIDGWSIRFTTFQSSCDFVPTRGARGLVAGRMIRDEQGAPQFQAIIESLGERERRRRPAASTR